MSIIVVRHVVAVHDLDTPQPFGVVNPFESRSYQAQRKTLLGAYRLAVLPVGNDAIVHRLRQPDTAGALYLFRAFRHYPRGVLLYAALFEQNRKQHARPFAATRQPVRLLHRFVFRLGMVTQALYKMNARY